MHIGRFKDDSVGKKRLPIKSRRHREKTKKSIEKSQETKIEQNRNQPVLSTVADVVSDETLKKQHLIIFVSNWNEPLDKQENSQSLSLR